MAGRITKYSEPVPFHKTMGTRKLVIMKRIDDDGVGNTNKGTVSMTDFAKIIRDHESLVLDFAKRQVEGKRTGLEKHDYLAAIEGRAAKLRTDGESPQQAFTKVITEDEAGKLLYKAMKIAPGAEVKPAPQPAPPSREAEAKLLGPAHAKMHSQAVDHQRANPRLSYEAAYSRMYTHPKNASLRAEINREHLGASMASLHGHGLGKAAPPDPSQDYVSPGPAHDALNELVVARMKSNPKLSYAQAFTHEYLLPANRSLKDRVASEGILRAQARG
jgi:hypothetical protein